MKIIIEVQGGVVVAVHTSRSAEIYIVDHDSLKTGEAVEYNNYEPDSIFEENELADVLDHIVND